MAGESVAERENKQYGELATKLSQLGVSFAAEDTRHQLAEEEGRVRSQRDRYLHEQRMQSFGAKLAVAIIVVRHARAMQTTSNNTNNNSGAPEKGLSTGATVAVVLTTSLVGAGVGYLASRIGEDGR